MALAIAIFCLSPPEDVYKRQLIRIAEIFHVSTDYLLLGSKDDSLDVSGLTIDQKAILVNLIKNFKETNESILFEKIKKKELAEKNRELEKRLKEKE